jgi:hypothetical protein
MMINHHTLPLMINHTMPLMINHNYNTMPLLIENIAANPIKLKLL